MPRRPFRVNTSSPSKLKEYQKLLGEPVEASTLDLAEPEADLLTIIRYKASQFENVLVDDVSLEVEGAEVGVNVKWLLQNLSQYIGRKACFICWVGVRYDEKIYVFRGEVVGELVSPRGEGFGFSPCFQAEGDSFTLAQARTSKNNARALAVHKFLKWQPDFTLDPLREWSGPFQNDS